MSPLTSKTEIQRILNDDSLRAAVESYDSAQIQAEQAKYAPTVPTVELLMTLLP